MNYSWIMARPIAHRGLHDAPTDIIENTVPAALNAIEKQYAIECDVQLSSDGEAMVFHDFALDRLTQGIGMVSDYSSAQLQAIAFRQGRGAMLPLEAFLRIIAGRVPLICEIKSQFNGDMRLTERTLETAMAQQGPIALKSFDPAIIIHLRRLSAPLPLGIISEATFDGAYWKILTTTQRIEMTNFLHFPMSKPDFLSWSIRDLPHPTPFILQNGLEIPVMAWTVRTPEQKSSAQKWADQIVFEGFTP